MPLPQKSKLVMEKYIVHDFPIFNYLHETLVIADTVLENSISEVRVRGLVFLYLITTLAEFLDANTAL